MFFLLEWSDIVIDIREYYPLMVYSRTVSESDQSDGYKPNRIIAYGDKWDQKLQDLVVNKNLGLRAVARELKVTTRTINRYVDKLGLNASWQSETTKFSPVNDTKEVDDKAQNRQDWLELQKQYPDATKTELRQLSPALYARLYRCDRAWLNHNSPSLQKPSVSENKRVDWGKRDQEVKILVEKAVQEILQKDKPERVTLRKVGVMTGFKAILEHKLDKLPLTKTYLQETVESVEMFQHRRIRWSIELLEQQGEEVKVWKIMRIAGLRNNCLERVENILY